MAEPPAIESGPIAKRLDHERLLGWMREQRWFASKSRALTGVEVVEEAALEDHVVLAMVQAEFATGQHDLYQLVLSLDSDEFDVLHESRQAHALLAAIDEGHELSGLHGRFGFRHVTAGDGARPEWAKPPTSGDGPEPVRPMGKEQSNSSIVFGDRIALKVFRKLEPGINPDLEMLRFLTAHDYANIAPLYGWYEYEGETLAATLAVAQQFVPDATDGWHLALEEIPTQPELFLERLAGLGSATARLHSVLATDAGDPAFSPQDPSSEFLNLLKATLDDQLEKVFGNLPEDDANVAPIVGMEQTVRERITLPSQGPIGGKSIRIHGDYHLGQTLHTQNGWTLLDFEGEPARPLNARRQKRSPLRDVASMLRSFSYATWAVKLQRGLDHPEDFEDRARTAFLGAYFNDVDAALLPTGHAQISSLLATFELEKALYELQYELDNRPDWVPIPVAGILRLLESE
jgi:maltokinase